MAPRRSQAATGAVNEGSSSALLHPDLAIDRLSSALSSWNTDGQDIVKQVLSNQTGSETVSASTIPISNSLIKILQSEIGVEEVTNCLQAVTESWETERKDVLWEALVDSVAVLSEAKDDSRDLKPTGEGMEVDDQTSLHAADKGIQVIKSLLVSFASFQRPDSSGLHPAEGRQEYAQVDLGFEYDTGSYTFTHDITCDSRSAGSDPSPTYRTELRSVFCQKVDSALLQTIEIQPPSRKL